MLNRYIAGATERDSVETELGRIVFERCYLKAGTSDPPFKLAHGGVSDHYFDCERVTTFAPAMPLIAEAFCRRLERGIACVGGPTRGADPIASSIAFYSAFRPRRINAFSVLKNRKEHGIPGWVQGSVKPGERAVLVDDVVTTGKAVIDALEKCMNFGLVVCQVIVLVERQEYPGLLRIKEYAGPHVHVEAIFNYDELLRCEIIAGRLK